MRPYAGCKLQPVVGKIALQLQASTKIAQKCSKLSEARSQGAAK